MSGAPPPRAATPTAAGQSAGEANVKAVRAQLELMEQDCCRVSAPDYTTRFSSLEDAVDRLLPFHMFGAEDPMQTDAREVDAAAVPTRLATSRHEAWRDLTTHRVNEYCAGLVVLEKRVQKAEAEALSRSQLPLLMLQSYATAEAQALVVQEQGRKVSYEREQREKKEAAERAVREQQERVQQLAAAQQMAAQQQQQALMMQRQQLLLQQQQQAAAAIAAKQQQQQQASAPKVQQQQQQQQLGVPQQVAQPPGMPLGLPPGMVPQGAGMAVRPPAGQPTPQQPAAKPLSAAEIKVQQLAALKARINQRK